jgi:hypothetical protein
LGTPVAFALGTVRVQRCAAAVRTISCVAHIRGTPPGLVIAPIRPKTGEWMGHGDAFPDAVTRLVLLVDFGDDEKDFDLCRLTVLGGGAELPLLQGGENKLRAREALRKED